MEKIVNADEATITAATVEIQVIRVGNRQMTQSVFKQLRSERFFAYESWCEEGSLKIQFETDGPLWGWVNYHPGGCSYLKEHVHVIWQKGNELRKWYLVKDPDNSQHSLYKKYSEIEAVYYTRFVGTLCALIIAGWRPNIGEASSMFFTIDDHQIGVNKSDIPDDVIRLTDPDYLRVWYEVDKDAPIEERIDKAKIDKAKIALSEKYGCEYRNKDQFIADIGYKLARDNYDCLINRWKEFYEDVLSKQLFLAV